MPAADSSKSSSSEISDLILLTSATRFLNVFVLVWPDRFREINI